MKKSYLCWTVSSGRLQAGASSTDDGSALHPRREFLSAAVKVGAVDSAADAADGRFVSVLPKPDGE